MLRLRRTLAFSARVHNYLVLLYLFFLGLFGSQLWWDTTEQFSRMVLFVTTILATVGLVYAAVLVLIALFLWIVDRIFPAWDVFTTIGRSLVFVVGTSVVSLFTSLSNNGLSFHF